MSKKSESEISQWQDISWLKTGDHRQRMAYLTLTETAILIKLKKLNATLVGTIPIGIYTDKSDLNIICESHDLFTFENILK